MSEPGDAAPVDEMRRLVAAKRWFETPLGPVETWSSSLRLIVDLVLSSGFPMALRWGPEFILIYNDAYRSILGDKHPWALGLPTEDVWSEVWHQIGPVHREVLDGKRRAFYADDILLRVRRHKGMVEDGRFTLSYSPTPDPEAPGGIGGVLVTAVETTARIEMENQLRTAEEKLRRLNERLEQDVAARSRELARVWENSRDLLVVLGGDGVLRAVSPAWTNVLGHAPDDVVGRSFAEFIFVEGAEPTPGGWESTVVGGDLTDFENRCRHKDGSHRWISWHTSVEGGFVYAYGRDVTAQKQAAADLEATQEALRQSQKMDAIGQLTGGIAHDFNNMLAIVIGSLDMARRRILRGEAGAERYLDNADDGARRAASLTQRLLAFSRQSPLSPQILDVNKVVAGMSELLRRTLGEPVALETALAGGLWLTNLDPNQLDAMVVNLAVNARDAMPNGGKLTIETANIFLDERYAACEIGLSVGQYVMIAVSDTGGGMTPDVLEKVFDPFFTTKAVGKGTGLGLSMVYGFAKQSGGHVKIYSEAGEGTTVKVYFPRHFGPAQQAGASPGAAATRAAASLRETVLVVEDEDQVRNMTCDALAELGYEVHSASSGEEAIRLYDLLDGAVDLLFTDVVMGGMSGRQLADALRRRAPDLKVLYTTGYTRNAVVHNGILDPGVACLPKPFTIADLASKLRDILDA